MYMRISRPLLLAASLGLVLGLPLFALTPARADVPAPPRGAFTASECEGTTLADPAAPTPIDADHFEGDVADLTQVFGARLDAYNDGGLAVLYDTFGANDWLIASAESVAFPPLCVVRHVAGIGAVSEWMFCTDYFSHVCGGTDSLGRLTQFEGEALAPLEELSGNPRLTPENERIIAYLIQNGSSYSGVGSFDFYGATRAVRDGDSYERAALQILIWCISDPVDPLPPTASEQDRADTCAVNMPPAEQDRILALTPETPVSSLSFTGVPGAIAAGDAADFVLSTNLYEQPIVIELVEGAGTLSVVGGGAALVGDVLTVADPGAAVVTDVTIRVTASTTGFAELRASAVPASRSMLGWSQSPSATSDGLYCQVFAKFDTVRDGQLQTRATTNVIAAPELAATGVHSVGIFGAAAIAVIVGLLSLVAVRRRPI